MRVWCSLLLLPALALLSAGAPAAPGGCGLGCRCYHLPEGGRAANCSHFHDHLQLPADLRAIRALPDAPGLASFLEQRLPHHTRHLQELYLADNEVVGPRLGSLRGLHKLRVLDLSFCELQDAAQLAALLKRTGSLETLRLSGNSLISLPALASDTLRDLDVSDCGIVSVRADTFTGLRRLRRLNLARNRLTNLAANLPHSLQFLDLSGNSLTHLPSKVVARLHRVDVSGNPLHCTCAMLRLRSESTREYVAVSTGAACTGPDQLRGLSLSGARRLCESRAGATVGTRERRQADPMDLLEGSGGGEGDGIGEDDELDDDNDDYFVDEDLDEEFDDENETGGADDESPNSQLGPQNVGEESAASSSSAPPVAASNDDVTRSLEDDIYEPTVPPPVPAAVDADAGAQPPSETPPESGPPAAESVEGESSEPGPDETGDVDGIHEPTEHEEEAEPVAAGVPDSEGEKKDDGKEEETGADVDDVFNEVMKNEDEAEDEDEDYDYDDDIESTTDETSMPDPASLDTGKEAEHETAPQTNETLPSSLETVDKKETLDTTLLSPEEEEEEDEDYEESEVGTEEKDNEVENTDDVADDHVNVGAAESTEATPVSLDTVHTNITSDSVVPAHDAEPHEDNEGAETDVNIIGEAEGSGEGDIDDSLPVGPITGFIDTDGHDGMTTTEQPDEDTLLIDEEDEADEDDTPLVPPGADGGSKTTSTEENAVVESEDKFAVVTNNTEREDSVSDPDDDEEEGSGMPFFIGGGDWEVEKTNETDEEVEVSSLGPTEIHEEELIVHRISPVESGREMSSSSESPLTTTTTEKPKGLGGLLVFNRPDDEGTTESPAHTALPVSVGAEGVSSSTAPPEEEEDHIVAAVPVPVAEAVPSEEPAETSPPSQPVLTSEFPAEHGAPEWADKEPTPSQEPPNIEEGEGADYDDAGEAYDTEAVAPTGDTPSNDTARVIVAGGEKPAEETPLNSAGSYVVLGIIMALVVFLLGYAVMRSRRGRQRAAAKVSGKDAEAAAGAQEGRELKEISKPLLGAPAVPAANGKGDHLQPLVTKPADNPDLKDDDGDEPVPEKPFLEPKTHIYETLNGGEKERVPVHPPSPKKSPSAAPDTLPADGDAVNNQTPPVPEKRRVLSRLPETAVDGAPNMYSADGLPGEVVAQQQQPTANGAATSPVNGLSSFAPPVSPSSGRVKVVAREDPDSVPKKPVFVVNQGPSTASGVV